MPANLAQDYKMNKPALTVYGSKVSYYTGKLEAYLRYKEIPYQFQAMTAEYFNRTVPEKTGAQQMPAVEFADGRWATDSTPLITWMEEQYSDSSVLPQDPAQAFLCRLIEDYADEWLWRPAMHYRWSHFSDRQLLGTLLVDELFTDVMAPTWLKRWKIRRRQKSHFVDKDGVNSHTRSHVELGYLRILEILQDILNTRPFVFGDRPTLADFGLFGPMFRHFSQDPTPAEIMRQRAPAVFAWVGRLWNARASACTGELVEGIPNDLLPLLQEISETHLPNLAANAIAWGEGKKQYAVTIQGTAYTDLPVSRYRCWCLEQLQAQFGDLPAASRDAVRTLLEDQGGWESLWQLEEPRSDYDPQGQAPFAVGLKVYPVQGA
jgi:glutathione S-transferase